MINHGAKGVFLPYVYLKDMVNQTAMSMKVVRLYSGLKVARMLFFICETCESTTFIKDFTHLYFACALILIG